jgi:hypothetical protein
MRCDWIWTTPTGGDYYCKQKAKIFEQSINTGRVVKYCKKHHQMLFVKTGGGWTTISEEEYIIAEVMSS